MDQKLGTNMKHIEEQMNAMAIATDEGIKLLKQEVEKERKERKEWQESMDEKLRNNVEAMEVDSIGESMIYKRIQKSESDLAKVRASGSNDPVPLVFGGLKGAASLEEAEKWS